MATAIQVSPGTSFPTITVKSYDANGALITGTLTVTALKDVTINNANDVFTWTQLDTAGKLQVPTTSTNSISTNLVVDETLFFGANVANVSAAGQGLLGISTAKTKTQIAVAMGTKTFTANAYVTGLAPTVSADSPVWVSPCTFTVTGDYAVS
jgi:hypothetical protein